MIFDICSVFYKDFSIVSRVSGQKICIIFFGYLIADDESRDGTRVCASEAHLGAIARQKGQRSGLSMIWIKIQFPLASFIQPDRFLNGVPWLMPEKAEQFKFTFDSCRWGAAVHFLIGCRHESAYIARKPNNDYGMKRGWHNSGYDCVLWLTDAVCHFILRIDNVKGRQFQHRSRWETWSDKIKGSSSRIYQVHKTKVLCNLLWHRAEDINMLFFFILLYKPLL